MSARFCKHCGSPYGSPNARFCKGCGAAADPNLQARSIDVSRQALQGLRRFDGATLPAKVKAVIPVLARAVAVAEENAADFRHSLAKERGVRLLDRPAASPGRSVLTEGARHVPTPDENMIGEMSSSTSRPSRVPTSSASSRPTVALGIATALLCLALLFPWGDVQLASVTYLQILSVAFQALTHFGGLLQGNDQLTVLALFLYLAAPAMLAVASLTLWTNLSPKRMRRRCLQIGPSGLAWCVLSYLAVTALEQKLYSIVPLSAFIGSGFFMFGGGSLLLVICAFSFHPEAERIRAESDV